MAKTKGMTDGALTALLDRAISTAENREGTETASLRNKSLEFISGKIDIPAEAGKSSVTSHDVADTLHWILPQLLRVFLGSDNIGIYEPRRRELETVMVPGPDGQPIPVERDVSEERAAQATDYVNYTLMYDCRGYSVLHSALYEGLAFGNGIIKHWWDPTPQYVTETYTGLSEEAFIELVDDDDVEVLEHTATPDPDWTPPPVPSQEELQVEVAAALEAGASEEQVATGLVAMKEALQAPQIHDVKIKLKVAEGRLQVRALPHEEFFVGANDLVIDEEETYLCGHAYRATRSDLIAQGFSKDKVNNLPAAGDTDTDETKTIRRGRVEEDERDHAMQEVNIYECYIRCDYDGDGVAEWRKVVMGGNSGAYTILSNEEWGDDLPFTDIVPDPVPHRWRGRSVFEESEDIQRIKSVLLRQMLDNLYRTNNPQRAVKKGDVENLDVLVNQQIGGIVFTKNDPAAAVRDLTVPFIAGNSLPILEVLDRVRAMRTGVSDQSMGLDADALQNQTATASNMAFAAAYTKMETYARNIAEVGMRRLFRCLLRLITKHQDRARTIRLRGEWVEMDPRAWHADMDVTINTGLGTGSREKDMAILNAILNEQKQIIMQSGPFNPIVDIRKFRDTLAKLVELSGLKSPERYFGEISEADYQQMKAQAEQPNEQPDPRMLEMQQKMEAERAKLALQMDKQAAEMQAAQEKAAAEIQLMRERAAAEIQIMREEAAARIQLMHEEKQMRHDLKAREIAAEQELAAYQIATGAAGPHATNIPSPVR